MARGGRVELFLEHPLVHGTDGELRAPEDFRLDAPGVAERVVGDDATCAPADLLRAERDDLLPVLDGLLDRRQADAIDRELSGLHPLRHADTVRIVHGDDRGDVVVVVQPFHLLVDAERGLLELLHLAVVVVLRD